MIAGLRKSGTGGFAEKTAKLQMSRLGDKGTMMRLT
jgi:hypothetical protein